MRVLLVHGWGFAPSLWDALRARPGHTWLTVDLGYFGPPRWDLPPALDLVAGHSFGCLWAMLHPGLAQVPLVSVAGFPRLRAGPDFPHGIPARVLERMLARLRQSPPEVLQATCWACATGTPAAGASPCWPWPRRTTRWCPRPCPGTPSRAWSGCPPAATPCP